MVNSSYDQPPEEEEGFLTSLALAPVRGIAGAASGVANLFGADVKDNFGLGHSAGFLPGLVEGVTDFMTGFIPAAGVLGKLGKAAGWAGKAKWYATAKNVAAGAVADFTVFDGNDPRLSNLIQSVPELQNPITEFLASDENDSESWGRLKNVLEGAALGGITDGLLKMFGLIKERNIKVAKGETKAAEELDKQIQATAEEHISSPMDDIEVQDQRLLDPTEADKPRLEELGREDPVQMAAEPPVTPVDPAKPQDPQVPQEPAKQAAPEIITEPMLRERTGWDSRQGEILLVDRTEVGGRLRGLTQFDHFAREPGAGLRVIQLNKDAMVLAAGSREANALLGNTRGEAKDVVEKRLLDLAEANGYDAVRFRKGMKAETVLLNQNAVGNEINLLPSEGFWDQRARGIGHKNPDLVNASPLEKAVYHPDTGLDEHTAGKVADLLKEAEKSDNPEDFLGKLDGLVNLAVMGERQQRAMYHILTEVVNLKGTVDGVRKWGDTILGAVKETASMLGLPANEVASRLSASAGHVDQAGNRAIGTRLYMKLQLKQLNALAHAISNNAPIEVAGRQLSRAEAELAMAQTIEGFQAIASQYGRLRRSAGRLLNTYAIGVDKLMENERFRSLEARGGAKQIERLTRQIIDDYSYGADHLSRQIMGVSRADRFWAATNDWFMFSLLSAPKTLTTNIIGTAMTALYKPLEGALGSWVGKKLLGEAKAAQFERTLAVQMRQFNILRQTFTETAMFSKHAGPVTESAKAVAERSWKTGDSVLLKKSGPIEGGVSQGISAENLSGITGKPLDPSKGLGKAAEIFGSITRLPARFMTASDEFFKQAGAISYLKSELIQQAREHGLEGVNADQWVEGELATFFRKGQLINEQVLRKEAEDLYYGMPFADETVRRQHIEDHISNSLRDAAGPEDTLPVKGRALMAKQAADFSLDTTFTKPLNPDDGFLARAGNLLQQFTNHHPMMRFFFPFIRTPLNILQFAAARAPIPGLNRDFIPMVQYLASKTGLPVGLDEAKNRFVQGIMHSDPKIAADTLGRASAALGAMATLGTAALSGVITGRGPEDPEQAKVLKQAGWQPYSIKVGDTYVSYQRLDPFASLMSFYADWADIARYGGSDQGMTDIGTGVLMATLANLESKSYLTGLSDLVGMLNDPVRKVPDALGRIAGSLAVPNVIAATRGFTDPHLPELNGMLDQVRSRIPVLAGGMDKQRNVLGEPLNKKTFGAALKVAEGIAGYMLPIQVNTTSSDTVTQELSDLAFPFSQPDPIRLGLDLRDHKNEKGQSAYDRWQELTGTVELGGRTLRSSLERLIKSNRYQALAHDGLERLDLDSPRVVLIKDLIGKYRRAAERQMLSEFQDVRLLTQEQRKARLALKSGEQPQDILSLLGR